MIKITPNIDNFSRAEFACPCCGLAHMNEDLLRKLSIARKKANIPFWITSGYRCAAHNAEVGGKPKSAHLDGMAVDIAVSASRQRFRILRSLLEAGFTRIGIAKNFVHADVRPCKGDCVIWLYL